MKVSRKKYEIPDKCPENCTLNNGNHITNWCGICPIRICGGDKPDLKLNNYRVDWASQWCKFFSNEIKIPNIHYLDIHD